MKRIIDDYMRQVSGIDVHCDRCLRIERWNGSVVLMVVDAAFTSIGLNYFTAVIPKIIEFNKKLVESGSIKNIKELSEANIDDLKRIWKNSRSWMIARNIASYLSTIGDDKAALRAWASNSCLEKWMTDPVGKMKGVGIFTFQYLRMMGGVDTVMPDKIVKRVVNEILEKSGFKPVHEALEFVKKTEEMALTCGYRPIELCWMTWIIQPEGRLMRTEKYSCLLSKI